MARSGFTSSKRYGVFAAACLILVFQASASRMLSVDERKIGIPGLHSVPWQMGKWKASQEQALDTIITAYLRPDEYILRDYVDQENGTTINLFVAYFKSLQNTYGPHSPRICLPGSGWLVSSSKIAREAVPGRGEPIPVNQFTMEKGNERILVLYWYQNDRDVWAEEFHAKLRLLPDLVRYHRSDVSLVRLITPLRGMTPQAELAESMQFSQGLFPVLAERFASVRTQR